MNLRKTFVPLIWCGDKLWRGKVCEFLFDKNEILHPLKLIWKLCLQMSFWLSRWQMFFDQVVPPSKDPICAVLKYQSAGRMRSLRIHQKRWQGRQFGKNLKIPPKTSLYGSSGQAGSGRGGILPCCRDKTINFLENNVTVGHWWSNPTKTALFLKETDDCPKILITRRSPQVCLLHWVESSLLLVQVLLHWLTYCG